MVERTAGVNQSGGKLTEAWTAGVIDWKIASSWECMCVQQRPPEWNPNSGRLGLHGFTFPSSNFMSMSLTVETFFFKAMGLWPSFIIMCCACLGPSSPVRAGQAMMRLFICVSAEYAYHSVFCPWGQMVPQFNCPWFIIYSICHIFCFIYVFTVAVLQHRASFLFIYKTLWYFVTALLLGFSLPRDWKRHHGITLYVVCWAFLLFFFFFLHTMTQNSFLATQQKETAR